MGKQTLLTNGNVDPILIPMTSYTKLKSGNWGIRSTTAIAAGQTVTVTKRDGGTKLETVERVVWSGNGVWLAAIAQRAQSSTSSRYAGRERMGSGHGYAAPVAGYSRYCTDNSSCGCYDCAS